MIILYNDQQRLVIEMLSVKLWSWQTETKYPNVNESSGFEQFTIWGWVLGILKNMLFDLIMVFM